MEANKFLIVNADDFGQNHYVNRGIMQAFETGIVTSASLMTRWPAAPEAADFAKVYKNLSVGLHLDFGEWFFRHKEWAPVYEVVPLDDSSTVEKEFYGQLDSFRRLLGTEPSHIDSHQHKHLNEPLHSIVMEYASKLSIPVRRCNSKINFCGNFYGQDENGLPLPDLISTEALIRILQNLPAGITEISCHPATAGCDLNTMYCAEREQELGVLCDPAVSNLIETTGIRLCSYKDFVL
jgi:chitin disaccharide deacetylase